MPRNLHPLIPIALRIGAVAAVGYATQRIIRAQLPQGRTDRRAEDALDILPEGITHHRPRDLPGQQNLTWRVSRRVRIGERSYELEGTAIARFRLREID